MMSEEDSRHKPKTYISYSMYQITWTIITYATTLYLFKYYHTVIGLHPILYTIAFIFITIWSALNSPLIGYLTDKNFKWTRKLGRRFVWIAIGIVPYCLMMILIFSAPEVSSNPIPTIIWFVIMMMLSDFFLKLTDIHVCILRADKFRTETERRKY